MDLHLPTQPHVLQDLPQLQSTRVSAKSEATHEELLAGLYQAIWSGKDHAKPMENPHQQRW